MSDNLVFKPDSSQPVLASVDDFLPLSRGFFFMSNAPLFSFGYDGLDFPGEVFQGLRLESPATLQGVKYSCLLELKQSSGLDDYVRKQMHVNWKGYVNEGRAEYPEGTLVLKRVFSAVDGAVTVNDWYALSPDDQDEHPLLRVEVEQDGDLVLPWIDRVFDARTRLDEVFEILAKWRETEQAKRHVEDMKTCGLG